MQRFELRAILRYRHPPILRCPDEVGLSEDRVHVTPIEHTSLDGVCPHLLIAHMRLHMLTNTDFIAPETGILVQ